MHPHDGIHCYLDDTPHYWDNFWSHPNEILGKIIDSSIDPDLVSRFLINDSIRLWNSIPLPNNKHLQLSEHYPRGAIISHNQNILLSNDSITASFRGRRQCPEVIQQAAESLGIEKWHQYVERHLRETYTIGGSIIFPRHRNSINQMRGFNRNIQDRWDLTLQCIKDFYDGKDSPIGWCIEQDKGFFGLFGSFEGYVDFFLLNDCVESDYEVIDWMPDTVLPRDADEYFMYMGKQDGFVRKRNERILSLHLQC